ncbi:MAG TPA: imidazolonepropionase [Terracidiphilus sp.]|jgi:imidazolonepropionase|nr:imidazolonepropionase [Terracidiphilus sp.]
MSFVILAIVNIGQLVTLAGPARPRIGRELSTLGIIENAALIIQDNHIAAAGPQSEIQIPPGATVIDAQHSCVTPGFVDAHTHLVFAGNRADEFEQRIAGATYQQIAAAGGGILRTVRLTRAASEDELLAAARRHRDWMLRGGTTTLEAKSGYGLDRETELKMLRVLARLNEEGPVRVVPTLLAAHTVPPEFAECRADYVRFVCEELIPEVARLKLARFSDAFCDDHAFTIDETRTVLSSARKHGLGIRIHAEQFRPGTGASLAAELGAATADHLETVTDETLLQLKAAGTQPVLLPGSVFALGRNQYPPARKMIELGLAIVVATDFNPGSSPVPSMPFLLSLSCLQMGLSPAEALIAATINAAYSLGLGTQIGSLQPGKQADFLIHEFSDYRELAYFIAAPARPRVFIGGREVTP